MSAWPSRVVGRVAYENSTMQQGCLGLLLKLIVVQSLGLLSIWPVPYQIELVNAKALILGADLPIHAWDY